VRPPLKTPVVEAQERLPSAMSDRLGYLLGQAHLAHRSIVEPALASLGLGVKEFGALSVLAGEGALSQQRLGERMRVDRTTMVAVVDELERKGFVERQRDTNDRRAYALQATGQGRDALDQAEELADQAEEDFLAPIPSSEGRRLKELLRTLISS